MEDGSVEPLPSEKNGRTSDDEAVGPPPSVGEKILSRSERVTDLPHESYEAIPKSLEQPSPKTEEDRATRPGPRLALPRSEHVGVARVRPWQKHSHRNRVVERTIKKGDMRRLESGNGYYGDGGYPRVVCNRRCDDHGNGEVGQVEDTHDGDEQTERGGGEEMVSGLDISEVFTSEFQYFRNFCFRS